MGLWRDALKWRGAGDGLKRSLAGLRVVTDVEITGDGKREAGEGVTVLGTDDGVNWFCLVGMWTDKASGKKCHITITNEKGRMSEKEIEKAINDAETF